jgi:hypothetical protein
MSATLIVAKNTSFVSDIYCCCKTFNGWQSHLIVFTVYCYKNCLFVVTVN